MIFALLYLSVFFIVFGVYKIYCHRKNTLIIQNFHGLWRSPAGGQDEENGMTAAAPEGKIDHVTVE